MPRRRLDPTLPQQHSLKSSPPSNDASPTMLITILILAIAVILFASLYLLLRFLHRRRHHTTTAPPPSLCKISLELSSLPTFTFNRLTAKSAGDCAVCLSKFDDHDVLRLLPVCCHAFHAECIDTWLSSSLTCPLCRSPIRLSESEILVRIGHGGEVRPSGSFRVEIGSVSSRNRDVIGGIRSYSLGDEFDYVINAGDDAIEELIMTSSELSKGNYNVEGREETRGGGVAWLKKYFSTTSSRVASFRSSGRKMTVVENEFEEVSRLGDEIGEFFRWLSGV